MEYYNKCNLCGKDFVSRSPKSLYCSRKCNRRSHYIRNKPKENEQAKQWYKRNREYRLIYTQEYRSKNGKRLWWKYHNLERFGGVKDAILKRDGYRCVICGTQNKLAVHHADGTNTYKGNANNDKNNLIVLCSSCHSWLHHEQRRQNKIYSREDIVRTAEKFAEAQKKSLCDNKIA